MERRRVEKGSFIPNCKRTQCALLQRVSLPAAGSSAAQRKVLHHPRVVPKIKENRKEEKQQAEKSQKSRLLQMALFKMSPKSRLLRRRYETELYFVPKIKAFTGEVIRSI